MEYIKNIKEKNGNLLRLKDIIDKNNKVENELISFFNIISCSENVFVQVVENKGYEKIINKEQGSLFIRNLYLENKIYDYLTNDGAIYIWGDEGPTYVQINSQEEKKQDIIVNFCFKPSNRSVKNDYFKNVYDKYFINMFVECHVKSDGNYINVNDYKKIRDKLKDNDEILIHKINIARNR